jgi:hypothetical protein
MSKRRFSLAGALCLVVFVFAGLAGCDNPSVVPDAAVLYPAPNPGPSLTPGDANLQVQFTKVETAVSYRVYYNTSPSVDWSRYQPVAQPDNQLVQTFLEGLINGVTYYVWAEAWYADTHSELNGPVSATPRAKPTPPASLSLTPYDGTLELSWPPVVDPACSADSYEIYWGTATGPTPPDEVLADSTKYEKNIYLDRDYAVMGLVTDLTNTTTYTVWIRAVNSTGVSDAYASATGVPTANPASPVVLEKPDLAKSDGSLIVTWDAVPGATKYKLYYNTTNEIKSDWAQEVTAGARRMNRTIESLTNKTPYYVWVAAVNGNYESAASPSNSETPQVRPGLNVNDASQVVGFAADRFPNEEAGKGDRLSRKQETALGDLVADSMYYWAVKNHTSGQGQNKTKIDFAFVNGGVIVTALAKGSINVGTLNKMLYGDQMSLITMTGAQIKTLFEERVAKVPHSGGGGKGTGAFGQVSSHVRYTIDYNHQTSGGIMSGLTLNGEPFVNDQSYTFVTSTYLYDDNTDGYVPFFLNNTYYYATGKVIAEAVATYIYDQNGIPIVPTTDGRITLVNEVWQ